MLAAPCYPPATDAVFNCGLSAPTRGVHALRCDAAIIRFQGAFPTAVGSALSCYINTYVAVVKYGPLISLIFVMGCDGPALWPRLALTVTPS